MKYWLILLDCCEPAHGSFPRRAAWRRQSPNRWNFPPDFGRVKPLFHHVRGLRAAVFTVIEGNQVGRVWVDQVANPTTAVVNSNFYYLTSHPGSSDLPADALKWLEDEVLRQREYTPIFSFTESWEAALQTILPAYGVQIYVRRMFDFDIQRYRELHTGWQKRIPTGFALHRLNAQTALDAGGMPEIWGSVENFLEHGFGFCMLDESQSDEHLAFAASVQTVFVGDCHAETGVETREPYRRKGLATALCCAYIDHCLQSGIYPEWGCGDENELSERLGIQIRVHQQTRNPVTLRPHARASTPEVNGPPPPQPRPSRPPFHLNPLHPPRHPLSHAHRHA